MPSIAVIGASGDRSKYGNKAVRAYLKRGWTVYPVNSRESVIEDQRAFRSILDVPSPVDRPLTTFHNNKQIDIAVLCGASIGKRAEKNDLPGMSRPDNLPDNSLNEILF